MVSLVEQEVSGSGWFHWSTKERHQVADGLKKLQKNYEQKEREYCAFN